MTLLWCSSKFAQLYKLSLCNKINIQPFLVEYQYYCTLGSEYLPRHSASANIHTLGEIFRERAKRARHYQGCTNSSWCGTYIYIYIYYIGS